MPDWKKINKATKESKKRIQSLSTEELHQARDVITDLLELRSASKLKDTYVTGVRQSIKINGENKIYFSFKMEGTVTGRFSCGGYKIGDKKEDKKGVSFHTLPRTTDSVNIRRVFVAPPGYAFVTADYSMQELRVLSCLAKEEAMQKAFIEGLDFHTYSGSLAFNKPMDRVTKSERQTAKETSFLVAYFGTPYTLSRKLGCSETYARHVINSWYTAYPAIQEYQHFIREFVRSNSYAYSIFGRARHLPNVKSKDKKVVDYALRQGLNFTIQSPASDILLCALLGIAEEFEHRNMKARIVGSVHDSIEFVIPYEELELSLKIIYYYMIKNPIMVVDFGINLDVPLKIEALVGHSFGDGIEVDFVNGRPTNLDSVMEYLNG